MRHARVSSRGRRLVRQDVRHADRATGARVAGDPAGPPRADRRAHRIGQDARRVPGRDRRAGTRRRARRVARRDVGRLRVAAQGAVQRHPEEPRRAARRHPRGTRRARVAGPRHPYAGAHGRHAAARAGGDAPAAAAHRRHHAGVAVHPARLGVGARDARDDAHCHRRRDPRACVEQARQPPRAVARPPRRARRFAAKGRPESRIALPPGAAQRRSRMRGEITVAPTSSAPSLSTSATCARATSRWRCRRLRSRR